MKRITVLGDGGWGTAIALLLEQKGLEVVLWGAFPEYTEEMRRTRVNHKFLPNAPLGDGLILESDAAAAVKGSDLAVVAIPTKFMRSALARIGPSLRKDMPYVTVAKGVEEERLCRGTEIIAETLGDVEIGILSGPSHAEEVSKGLPTAVVAAAADEALAREIQSAFMTKTFRVYTSTDVIGVEIAGAVKNVMAIAAGICDGLGLGDNSKAALVTRGLAEMTRLGVDLGADAATFRGLAGVGDLMTTCYSKHSRNRSVGERLGRGETGADIENSMEMVAEGVRTTKGLTGLARERGVEMPIAEEVRCVLFEDKPAKDMVPALMERPPKSERESFESA